MRRNRFLSQILALAMLVSLLLANITGVRAENGGQKGTTGMKTYKLWYDEDAPHTLEGFLQSLPLGNGYMGINVFGGVETEMLSVTENSLFNPFVSTTTDRYTPSGEKRVFDSRGGLGLLARTYIDFDHTNVSNYERSLLLNDAVASVSYDNDGVHYTREYFATYPDKVTVMRLSADQPGALSFTLRPVAPFVSEYLEVPGDGMGKTGKVVASGDSIVVSGMMDWYDINYEGLYKVIPQGGTMVANNDENGENGTITVTGADSVVILLAVGTNYHMVPESFASNYNDVRMDPNEDPHEKVQGYMDAAAEKSYEQLLDAHLADYREYFNRAELDLGGVFSDTMTTDKLIDQYQSGDLNPYMVELAFQYGRYLLIASSREGCLPANLQGIWNNSDTAHCSGGYWHNINIQMNYWPAFSANLIDLFESYADYNETFRKTAQGNADSYLISLGAENRAPVGTGQNGWVVGTNCSPYRASAPGVTGHSGPGTGAFTALLFWDYYDFTRDETILEEHTYPALEGMSSFLTKTLKEYDDGKWLVYNSASPENADNYRTVGTAFDQQMVYENHLATLKAAEALGYSVQENPLLALLEEQLDKLDPVNVGYSGQVKEYREENYYGEIGDPKHRHISQLVGLYPGTAINDNTPAWQDAAAVSLTGRGTTTNGWPNAHRGLCWARLGDAEQAYACVQAWLNNSVADNLFSTYKYTSEAFFQIDGNFGYTAMVAEMLVQGHAGYIEFLPTLPEEWDTGSFYGLTTRGAFEVDAAWCDGQAKEFVIRSKAGSDCSVKYQNIATATVTDSKGNPVTFTADGTDLISFATQAGESYTITNISPIAKVEAPTGLKIAEGDEGMVLNWTASKDAVSYNVYRAVNDAAAYEQIATGVSGTTYNYAPQDISGEDRVTLRVTALGENGRESTGVLTYSLPVAPPEKAEGAFFGEKLQLEIAGGEGACYRVYEDGVAVCETTYPIAVVENASASKTYTVCSVAEGRVSTPTEVTMVTGMVDKTELYKAVQAYGGQLVNQSSFTGVQVAYILAEPAAKAALLNPKASQLEVDLATRDLKNAATEKNIFQGKSITATQAFSNTYAASKLLDGKLTTRYSTKTGVMNAVFNLDLGASYLVEGVFFQEYLNYNEATNCGEVTVEVYDGNRWNTVLDKVSLRKNRDKETAEYYHESYDAHSANTAFVFEKSALATKVRVTINSTTDGGITLYELQAYGQKVGGEGVSLSKSVLTVCSGASLPLTATGNVASWESSNGEVVSVEGGKLKAVGTGTATVTATGTDGSKASCFVTVVDAAPLTDGVEVYSGGKLVYSYKSFAEAAENAAACDGIVKLKRNVEEEVTIQGDLWVDLNGFDLSGITVTGTVYGMDSSTNDYTGENAGSLRLVSGKVAASLKTTAEKAGAIFRYLAVEEAGAYSFHRFYMGITHLSLQPRTGGVGYKAVFYGDEKVAEQVTGYGYTLWVGQEGQKHSFGKEGAFTSGKNMSLRLDHFDIANYGETEVFGQVYVTLADGSRIESSVCRYTLRQMVEAVSKDVLYYTKAQILRLQEMLSGAEEVTASWDIDAIRNYK